MHRSRARRLLDAGGVVALYAVLVGAPLASGAYRGWPLAAAQLVLVAGVAAWAIGMAWGGRLEWRRTGLDLPLALLVVLVLAQLALGNAPLVAWALAPPSGDPLAPVSLPVLPVLGTVSPAQTVRSLRLFLAYVAVYVLVVNLVRSRRALERLVRTLLLLGAALAFLALLDYLAGETWLLRWGEPASRHRLSATFVNPDHFAAWLAMSICLGIGYVLARSRPRVGDVAGGGQLGSREGRERIVRHYLPMIGIAVMTIALVFTLSRAGIASLLLALAALLGIEGARGRARSSLVVVGILLAVTVGYASWIGLEPLLARFEGDLYGGRLIQVRSTLDMVRAFPLLGVGLGAYRDIYFRYQPPELSPGKLYFPYAHNDLLQLVVELGLIGTAICAFAAWRIGRDLLGAHLLGRGRCPVGGGEDEGARRSERSSVGIGLGAVAGILALLAHSAFDFGARIPADGVLGAACLGIATVALHTRFGAGADRLLTEVRAVDLGPGPAPRVLVTLAAAAAGLACVPGIARVPIVESRLEAQGPAAVRVERALALAPRDPEARWARARVRLALAHQIWDSGQTSDGRLLVSWPERRREALAALDGAIEDARAALSRRPSDPFLHETLGRAHGSAAAIDDAGRAAHQAAAFGALRRAIALQPGNPYLYRSLAALALGQRPPVLPVALAAARDAIARDPSLLPGLADRFLPFRLSEAQWAELVPDGHLDRLELALLLDRAGLGPAAEDEYRRAAALAPPGVDAFARWALGRSLMRRGDPGRALAEIDAALATDRDNPELHLLRARVLAERRDAAALDAYRAALASAEARAARPGDDPSPFSAAGARAKALVARALGEGDRGPARYRRALAEYLGERKLWDQAALEWQRVSAGAPLDAGAHFMWGRALAGMARPAEALDEYRRAVALDGRSPFRMALARSLWESEQYYQAMNEWRAVLLVEPGNLEARLALGDAYAKAGDRPAAIAEYQRVLDLAPGHPEARRGLARLLRGG